MRIHRSALYCAAYVVLALASPAFGHVRISPRESVLGATQKYSMSVPTERQSPTVRVEATFPVSVIVLSLAAAPGWTVEEKKDAGGRIVGGVWSGGSIPFAESAEFSFEARNPTTATRLEWKVIQIYQDGTRSEWTGPENSRTPSPVTTVK
jgi:uncharacterized protein YcnI